MAAWKRQLRQGAWAYAAIAIALGLVWGEALRSRVKPLAPVAESQPAGAATQEVVASAPATGPMSGTDLTVALIRGARHLGSANVEERAAAEKVLAQATHRQRRLLRDLAGSANSDQARDSLTKRAGELDMQVATNPPPISLSLRGANLFDLMEALNTEMGTEMRIAGADSQGAFTLEAKERPFWETVQALNRQTPLNIAPETELAWSVMPPWSAGMTGDVSKGWMLSSAIQEPFFFYADVSSVATGRGPTRAILRYTLLSDPRVRLLDVTPTLTVGPDETGAAITVHANNAVVAGNSVSIPASSPASLSGNGVKQLVQMTVPGPGKLISSVQLKGSATVGLAFSRGTYEIAGLEGQKLQLGVVTVTVQRARVEQNRLVLELDAQEGGKPAHAIYTVLDSTRRPRLTLMSAGKFRATLPGAEPMRLQIEAAQGVKKVEFGMELKDVALNR